VEEKQYEIVGDECRVTTVTNDGLLVRIREYDISFVVDGDEAIKEMTNIDVLMVVKRGLWFLQLNNMHGVQGFVWVCGEAKAAELLDMYGEDCIEMAKEKAGGGIEEMPFEELTLPPQKRTANVSLEAKKMLAKVMQEDFDLPQSIKG
jgi:hypothetical protein